MCLAATVKVKITERFAFELDFVLHSFAVRQTSCQAGLIRETTVVSATKTVEQLSCNGKPIYIILTLFDSCLLFTAASKHFCPNGSHSGESARKCLKRYQGTQLQLSLKKDVLRLRIPVRLYVPNFQCKFEVHRVSEFSLRNRLNIILH